MSGKSKPNSWNSAKLPEEETAEAEEKALIDAGLYSYVQGTASKYLAAASYPTIVRQVMDSIRTKVGPAMTEFRAISEGTLSGLLGIGPWLDGLVLILQEEGHQTDPSVLSLIVFEAATKQAKQAFLDQAEANSVGASIEAYLAFFVEMFGEESMGYEQVLIGALGARGLIDDADYTRIHGELLERTRRLQAKRLREEIDND